MPLRSHNPSSKSARRRLRAALVAAALAGAFVVAGASSAGVSDYPSPLYLSGGPSSVVTGSYQLLASAGPSVTTTPTVTPGAASSGVLSGVYSYIYTAVSGSAYSASGASPPTATLSSQTVTVGNLPSGTDVAIYRQKWNQAAGTNAPYLYVANSGGATTYLDNNTDAAISGNAVLPEAANRVATMFSATCAATTCGYLDFSPGIEVSPATSGNGNTTPPTLSAAPSSTPTSKGWIVDGGGSVTFAAGTWTFSARTKSNNANGTAHLVVGVWKADPGVAASSWTAVLDPTCTGSGAPLASCPGNAEGMDNIRTASGNATVTVSVALPKFSLASSEHLYVQFWRRQTTAYSSGAASSRLATMLAYDSTAPATITHPAADADAPSAFSITAPTGATPVANGVTLQSDASDPTPGSGIASVDYYYCPGFACSVLTGTLIGTSSSSAPYSVTWSSQPPDNTYSLVARATDNVGFTTDSTPVTVVVDNTPPDTTITSAPAAATNSTNASFSFTSADVGATFKCSLDGAAFAACTSPKSYSGLSEGSHTFDVEAVDTAGNVDPTPSHHAWTVDTTAPTMSITASPTDPDNSSSPSFSFSASETVTGTQCSLDGAAYASCSSPKTYSSLADGAHTFAVKATADSAGNAGSPTSYAWTIDTTAPNTTITSAPANPSSSANASISFTSTEGGTFKCSLDGGAFSTCTSAASLSSLSDASHTFAVEAVDTAGNTDPSPASTTWTVDTTAPVTTIDSKPTNPSTDTAPSFAFSANEAVTGFQCSLDGAAFAACTSAKSYSGLADGSHTFQVKAVADTAGNAGAAASYAWTVDTAAPDTSITASPASLSGSANASFTFTATEPGTFKCSLDNGAFALCASPASYTGLADGAHTFQVEAVDGAGNTDASPASSSWTIDTTAPDTLIGPTKPALVSTSANATFDVAATEGGSTFACALDGAGFAACSTPQVYSGLADGLHSFQVRATDGVGNADASPATYSWTIDTTGPSATPTAPGAGTSVKKSSTFGAVFTDTPGDTGTVDFRICVDPACVFVLAQGTSGSVASGDTASWAWTASISGYYYWAVRARDAAGNTSAWSAGRLVRVDASAPAAPPRFTGTVTNGTLALTWQAPTDDVGSYVVFVNGEPWRTVDGSTRSVTIGSFDAADTRRFAVRAIDMAGNVGAESPTLVGVPNVVGLSVTKAADAAAARGLLLRNQKLGFGSGAGVVMAQSPAAPAVLAQGSTVQVLLAPISASMTPLVQAVHPIRITCAHGSRQLQLQVALSRRASVKWSLLGVRRIARGTFGSLPAGTSRVKVAFPKRARHGRYKLVVVARSQGEQVSSTVRVALTSRAPESASSCGR